MQTLGVDNLTVARALPTEFIPAAAAAGVRSIGLWLKPFLGGPAEERPILTDLAMRGETMRSLADHEVKCDLISGWRIAPDSNEPLYRTQFDASVELGARFICLVNLDPEPARARDNLGLVCALAKEYGVQPTLEFSPKTQVRGLADAMS